ncbi:uncharacterized protein LOC124373891 isoform X1 [Homalodisca vitripennis]|uniref:uncharacterized protein LOC124373891 isoform X1 n=1 Tax=Homalodisca vitripennis TaxID=197043 RepID=UPI001EEA9DA3|nr:uncharacterized protein LOC124373891 isoform X1 [Homalodisca vitripennis]
MILIGNIWYTTLLTELVWISAIVESQMFLVLFLQSVIICRIITFTERYSAGKEPNRVSSSEYHQPRCSSHNTLLEKAVATAEVS